MSLDTVESLTIADLDTGHAARLAAELDVGSASTPEALVDAGIDALVIAAPTPAHRELLSLAAAAGLPAFCEKPVALDLPTLDDVIAETDAAGILVQVGFQRRFDAGYRAAREAVASGAVGDVLVLRAATHDPSPPPEAYIAASGGIFRDLHIHDFDAIRFVTGREIVEVYADGAVRTTEWFADHDDVDVATAMLRLDDGTLAIVSGTRHDPLGYDVRLEVFGTKDSIAVGVDDSQPLPIGRGRRRAKQTGLRELHGAVRSRLPGRARDLRRPRARTAEKAPARSRTRAPRSPLRSLPTARAPSGLPCACEMVYPLSKSEGSRR